MVADGAVVAALGDPPRLRRDARRRGRLAPAAGRPVLDLVAPRYPAPRTPAAGRHPRHDQPGEAAARHREDPRSHGATPAEHRRCRGLGGDDDVEQHMPGRRPGCPGVGQYPRAAVVGLDFFRAGIMMTMMMMMRTACTERLSGRGGLRVVSDVLRVLRGLVCFGDCGCVCGCWESTLEMMIKAEQRKWLDLQIIFPT